MESKSNNSKRGPGRPRKDLPQHKGNVKRKNLGDHVQCNDRNISIAPLSSSESSNAGYPEDKAITNMDEISSIEYPGKMCCLCNLDEKSALGQGDFLRWELDPDNCEKAIQYYLEINSKNDDILRHTNIDQVPFRRQKNNCRGKISQNDCFNELDKIGHSEKMSFDTILDGSYIYLHRMCLMWSQGVYGKTNEIKANIEFIIAKSFSQKCSFCGQYGASITCKMSCTKIFHLPCAAASASFQIMDNFMVFCFDHIEHVMVICKYLKIPDNF